MGRQFATPDPTVTIEPTRPGEAVVTFASQTFDARFDTARRGWLVGERFSPSPKLHSIGKLFGIRRAAVLRPSAAPPPELPPPVTADDPSVSQQVRRILASMQEFRFDGGGAWHSLTAHGFEEGWTPRVAGDPIYHTIGQVAGVEASRAETIEGIAALLDGRRPNLPPRLTVLPAAVKLVAEALAAGARLVVGEFGSVRIEGPMLPENWDSVSADSDDTMEGE